MRYWPYLGILSFFMGCAGIPPQIVEKQIEDATVQIHTVQLRSEPLNQAESYLNQAILAQTEKRWEQAYQLGESSSNISFHKSGHQSSLCFLLHLVE